VIAGNEESENGQDLLHTFRHALAVNLLLLFLRVCVEGGMHLVLPGRQKKKKKRK